MASAILDELLGQAAAGWRWRINTCFFLRVDRQWGFATRRNRDCHLLHVLAGRGRYVIGEDRIDLARGSTVFVAPGMIHSARPETGDPPQILALRFDLHAPADPGACWRGTPAAVHAVLGTEAIARQAREIAELHGGGAVAELRQHGRLVELLHALLVASGGTTIRATDPILALCRKLRTHPQQRTPVAALARQVGLSEKHFIRAFKNRVGCTPHAYLVRARIEQAEFLLTESSLSAAAIAEQLGYPDAASFSRQFNQLRGMPPGRWRNHHGAA